MRTSKSGINRTNRNSGPTAKRNGRSPFPADTVNPPKTAGAALSGCPSRAAQIANNSPRLNGSPASRFNPAVIPSRRVTLLPKPLEVGTSPSALQRIGNSATLARLKNALATSAAIG